MFRVYCVAEGQRLTSAPCPSAEVADSFLAAVLSLPGVIGGAVEQLTGCGWVCWIPEPDRELLEIC